MDKAIVKCPNCGASDAQLMEEGHMKCSYCSTLYHGTISLPIHRNPIRCCSCNREMPLHDWDKIATCQITENSDSSIHLLTVRYELGICMKCRGYVCSACRSSKNCHTCNGRVSLLSGVFSVAEKKDIPLMLTQVLHRAQIEKGLK